MSQPIQAKTKKDIICFCAALGLPALNPEAVTRQKPDACWMRVDSLGNVVARCSLWWSDTPPYPGHRLGLIGHYAAQNTQAAARLLQLACAQLAEHNCTMAVGPMDGNTWQSYRLIIEQSGEPIFFLEPDNPVDWPIHFTGNGFNILAQYFSTLNPDLSHPPLDLGKVAQRAASRGVKIRPFRLDCFDEELGQIYNIALAGFSRNFLYTSISRADFTAMYEPLRPHIQPELILIAERNNRPIGFIFALPDLLKAQRGQVIDTVIIKTVAVHPAYQIGGLGSLLVARCQEVARKLGYRRAIHALMHERNDSRKISRRHQTETIRRYALFARAL